MPHTADSTPTWIRTPATGNFTLYSTATVDANYDCISALLSDDGSHAWLAAINYNTHPYTGLVESIDFKGNLFAIVHRYELSAGAMRIAVTADGRYAAASLHTGGCALFCTDQPASPKWTFVPPLPNLSLAYAVGITQVSATDGKPKEKTPHGAPPRTYTGVTVSESPGNFYLYDATTGARLWQYPTTIMNWPMGITPNGSVALGGRDDGSLYYWKLV